MFIHLTATAFGRPLINPAVAWWLWRRLRHNWPEAVAACLMYDHVHLVVASQDPARDRVRMAHVLGALSRYKDGTGRWKVPRPTDVLNAEHLTRAVRYAHLNPCRAGLARDPLAWPWSTHRGLIGAEVNPWVTPDRLAPLLERSVSGFVPWLHTYVSGDPSVSPAGSLQPKPAPKREHAVVPLGSIASAALAATPWSSIRVRRRVLALLARHQGWKGRREIAGSTGVTPRSVARYVEAPRHLVGPAALCLGDERLALAPAVARELGTARYAHSP